MGIKSKDDTMSEEDRSLFREAMDKIKKIKQERVILKRKPIQVMKRKRIEYPATATFTISDYQTEATVTSDDNLFYARPGLSEKQIRELRQGKIKIQARLDLHGFNTETARDELITFIDDKYKKDLRYLCIIHGKGHSDQPVLKNKLNNWLRQIDKILAFATARSKHGGAGAVYVLLKSNKR